MIKIYNADNITEANIVSSMLAAHGIDAHVSGQYLQGGVGELVPMDFAAVNVAEEQADAALALIAAYEADNPDRPSAPEENLQDSGQPAWLEALIYVLIIFGILSLYLLLN